MSRPERVVVLGAGSAGLTAAYHLVCHGVPVELVEMQPDVGGLALTFDYNGFRLDYGPHAFHSKGDEADEIFLRFCEQQYRKMAMRASLLLEGRYFEYPLRFGQALLRLPPSTTARILWDYGRSWLARHIGEVPEDTFEAWGVKRYGRTMYELAFGFYSSKVWGMSPTLLSRKLAEQKLPDLRLRELIREAFGGRGAKQKILYSSYVYPRGGIGVVFERMRAFIEQHGGIVRASSRLAELRVEHGRIVSVAVNGANGPHEMSCSHVIATIPIPHVANALQPAQAGLLHHANRLVYRNLILTMLVVESPNVTNEMMVYLLDRQFTSNRIGEQKNLDESMIPPEKTVLTFEMCVDEDSDAWQLTDEDLRRIAERDLLALGTVRADQISGSFVRRLEHAYPVYDLTFDQNLKPALDALLAISNLVPLGRQGLFIHNDIHDSMAMGLEGAKHVLSGAPPSAWAEKVRTFLDWRLR